MSQFLLVSPLMSAAAEQSIKIKQQRDRYNNGQRERKGGKLGNRKQCSSRPEVDLHGPAMMLESITGTNHLKVLGQRLLGLYYFLQDVFPLVQKVSSALPLEVEKRGTHCCVKVNANISLLKRSNDNV